MKSLGAALKSRVKNGGFLLDTGLICFYAFPPILSRCRWIPGNGPWQTDPAQ